MKINFTKGMIKEGSIIFQKDCYKKWPIQGTIGEKNPYIIFDICKIENNDYPWLCRCDGYGDLMNEYYGDGPIFVNKEDDIIFFKKEFCIHYMNIDYGIECAARNCPCDIFQHKNLFLKNEEANKIK